MLHLLFLKPGILLKTPADKYIVTVILKFCQTLYKCYLEPLLSGYCFTRLTCTFNGAGTYTLFLLLNFYTCQYLHVTVLNKTFFTII